MDLVDSVTQNSNNRSIPMENQGSEGNDDKFNNAGSKNSNNNQNQLSVAPENSAQKQVPDYLKAIGMDPRKFWPKKYRFTREKPPGQYNPMTISQRNFYENNGYIVIDDCAPKRLIDSVLAHYKSDSFVNDFFLDKLMAKNGKFLQHVKCFCDDRVMLMTHQLVETFQTNELARVIIDKEQTNRQELFRDWIYLPFRPIDKVVCAVTAFQPIDNVILVVPGTHKVGQCSITSTLENISAAYDSSQEKSAQLKEIFECAPEKLSNLVDKSRKGFKYVNLKPGQTLFYHPGLIHGFSNDLINFRKSQLALIAYYAAADCEYIDLRKSSEFMQNNTVPFSLAQFKDKNPSDYSSWIETSPKTPSNAQRPSKDNENFKTCRTDVLGPNTRRRLRMTPARQSILTGGTPFKESTPSGKKFNSSRKKGKKANADDTIGSNETFIRFERELMFDRDSLDPPKIKKPVSVVRNTASRYLSQLNTSRLTRTQSYRSTAELEREYFSSLRTFKKK